MNSLEANIRENSTKGQLNALRNNGNVPAIIYGGKDHNQKISISIKSLKMLIENEIGSFSVVSTPIFGDGRRYRFGCQLFQKTSRRFATLCFSYFSESNGDRF